MNLTKNIIVATALAGVLAMAALGAVQAGDDTPVWRTMKPSHAISFDVGRKHVLSYFLRKNGLCELTMMVTDRPDEASEGDEIPTLTTTRFKAVIKRRQDCAARHRRRQVVGIHVHSHTADDG